MESRSILGEEQAGFRRGRRTTHHLQRLIMAMEDAKMSKRNIQVLYVDFVDAFGSVDHTRLRCVMRSMGIPEGL
eukprot:6205202-Pyramimonas_sp.AAC.1